MILFILPALAGPTVDATLLAGARTAPESAIQVPSAWEGQFEPSGLLSGELRARFGKTEGPWARLAVGGWGYAPDLDASLATGGLGLGWSGKSGPSDLAIAGRYEGQVFPALMDATNGRSELIARARRDAPKWGIGGQLTAVDRRFVGAAGFTTAELGATLSLSPGAWGVDLGLSGQGNLTGAGPIGAQGRTLERLRVGGASWRLALEHRLVWAFEGEVEEETRAAFTPIGDYADDVDALSGGGFLQNRVGLSGAVTAGAWTVSAGGFGRVRSADEGEESAVSFVRTWSGQARVERRMSPTVSLFVAGGAASATLGTGVGYLDGFGWLGVDLRTKGS